MQKLLIICGATATGKTRIAVDCAKLLNTEIISADSQLVYKGLNVGTAKPTIEEKDGVVHHMIDVASPYENYSVSDYEKAALPIVDSLISQGKTPVICGGTGFYVNSLLYSFSYGNTAADESVRQKLEELLQSNGKEALYEQLRSVDPETAEKLHVNDVKRVIRALEIFYLTGNKKSEQNDVATPRYNYLAVAVDYPREELYERINKRVDIMFENGLIEEVKNLLAQGINENCRCMQAIGYKEILECLKNGDNNSTMRDIIKQNTRRYAKRQITFFKKLPNVVWLKPEKACAEEILKLL